MVELFPSGGADFRLSPVSLLRAAGVRAFFPSVEVQSYARIQAAEGWGDQH